MAVIGVDQPIRVPIYRCHLVEMMEARLFGSPDAGALGDGQQGHEIGETAVLGPDIMCLSPAKCTSERFDIACAAGFAALLSSMGLDASLPSD